MHWNKSTFGTFWASAHKIVDDCDYIITKLADITKIALNSEHANFGVEFRSPGYMPLLNAAPNLLNDRRGQTELFIVLA